MSTPTAKTSAASSKLELVMDPCWLDSETTSWEISGGNAKRQTTGRIAGPKENQTPLAPSATAS